MLFLLSNLLQTTLHKNIVIIQPHNILPTMMCKPTKSVIDEYKKDDVIITPFI